MKPILKKTADGSNTLYLAELDESYHSVHGAIQEAQHVFIQNGLHRFLNKTEAHILEIGFGTGLNAFLSLLEAQERKISIHYTGLEAFPIDTTTAANLGYSEALESTKCAPYFIDMHRCEWGAEVCIHPFFSFRKIKQRIEHYNPSKANFDCIYFDAFSPRSQPDMWKLSVFDKLYAALRPAGFFVTYCAKGQVKRDLRKVGFLVHSVPGPPGKREMIVAEKPISE